MQWQKEHPRTTKRSWTLGVPQEPVAVPCIRLRAGLSLTVLLGRAGRALLQGAVRMPHLWLINLTHQPTIFNIFFGGESDLPKRIGSKEAHRDPQSAETYELEAAAATTRTAAVDEDGVCRIRTDAQLMHAHFGSRFLGNGFTKIDGNHCIR